MANAKVKATDDQPGPEGGRLKATDDQDVEGHKFIHVKLKATEDLGPEGVKVKASDDSDVEGHKYRVNNSEDRLGASSAKRPQASDEDDVEGHRIRLP